VVLAQLTKGGKHVPLFSDDWFIERIEVFSTED